MSWSQLTDLTISIGFLNYDGLWGSSEDTTEVYFRVFCLKSEQAGI